MKESLLIIAPGRGSYSKATMNSLQNRTSPTLQKIHSIRQQQQRLSPIDIDALARFKASKHLAGASVENTQLGTWRLSKASAAAHDAATQVARFIGPDVDGRFQRELASTNA